MRSLCKVFEVFLEYFVRNILPKNKKKQKIFPKLVQCEGPQTTTTAQQQKATRNLSVNSTNREILYGKYILLLFFNFWLLAKMYTVQL